MMATDDDLCSMPGAQHMPLSMFKHGKSEKRERARHLAHQPRHQRPSASASTAPLTAASAPPPSSLSAQSKSSSSERKSHLRATTSSSEITQESDAVRAWVMTQLEQSRMRIPDPSSSKKPSSRKHGRSGSSSTESGGLARQVSIPSSDGIFNKGKSGRTMLVRRKPSESANTVPPSTVAFDEHSFYNATTEEVVVADTAKTKTTSAITKTSRGNPESATATASTTETPQRSTVLPSPQPRRQRTPVKRQGSPLPVRRASPATRAPSSPQRPRPSSPFDGTQVLSDLFAIAVKEAAPGWSSKLPESLADYDQYFENVRASLALVYRQELEDVRHRVNHELLQREGRQNRHHEQEDTHMSAEQPPIRFPSGRYDHPFDHFGGGDDASSLPFPHPRPTSFSHRQTLAHSPQQQQQQNKQHQQQQQQQQQRRVDTDLTYTASRRHHMVPTEMQSRRTDSVSRWRQHDSFYEEDSAPSSAMRDERSQSRSQSRALYDEHRHSGQPLQSGSHFRSAEPYERTPPYRRMPSYYAHEPAYSYPMYPPSHLESRAHPFAAPVQPYYEYARIAAPPYERPPPVFVARRPSEMAPSEFFDPMHTAVPASRRYRLLDAISWGTQNE